MNAKRMIRRFLRQLTAALAAARLSVAAATIGVVAVALPVSASAASLKFTTDSTTPIPVSSTFNVDVKVSSPTVGVNAAQATLQFDPTVLNVTSFDTTGSVFGFWLVGPDFSNSSGTVKFIGGATDGFSGQSLQILRVNFKAIAAGTVKLVFNDAAVTASDGSGTNVLDETQGLDLVVSGTTSSTQPAPNPAPTTPQATEGINGTQPEAPEVKVEKYSNQYVWYNSSEQFVVTWVLDKDVTDVAAVVNKIPTSKPTQSIGKVSKKTFSALGDGVWYVHVRFKNAGGWSDTTHYRIRIDTTPPEPVTILDHGLLHSLEPRPIIPITAKDSLSGVQSVTVQLDNGAIEPIKDGKYQPAAPLLPGVHTLRIVTTDNAGNTSYADSPIALVPLGKPVIISADSLTIGKNEVIVAAGTAKASYNVVAELKDSNNRLLDSVKTVVTSEGKWTATLRQPLLKGFYFVEATSTQDDGARSLPVRSRPIEISGRIEVIRVAGYAISYANAIRFFFALAAALLALSLGLVLRQYHRMRLSTVMVKKNMELRFFKLKHDIKDIIDRHHVQTKKQPTGDAVKWDIFSRLDKELSDQRGDIDDLTKK